MQKRSFAAIDYIRGISMLGVIGIHIGSQYLMNPLPNVNLVALFEVATRFAVPIFFFISAFGMFYHLDKNRPLNYVSFLRRRAKTVLVPYLVWSVFYILHYTWLFHDRQLLHLKVLAKYFFFGFGSYQLYFLVILLWFYLLMPLWVWLMKRLTLKGLAALLIFQLAFNYYSSFVITHHGIANLYLRALIENRLNYWVLHYLFIFMLGGWLAWRADEFITGLKQHRYAVCAFFFASLAGLLGYYYKLLYADHYTPLAAICTAHQLCPAGVIYTVGASLFFFGFFTHHHFPTVISNTLSFLGRHSYFAYLVHPVFITYCALYITRHGIILNAPKALALYLIVVLCALLAAVIFRKLGQKWPWINKLTIGA